METRELEVWKAVPGYESRYEVSSWGNVKTLEKKYVSFKNQSIVRKEKVLKCYDNKRGYLVCTLYNSLGRPKTFQVHILVALVFLKEKKANDQVNHKDTIKLNNYYKNLEYVTNRENQTHRYLTQKTSSIYPGVSFKKDGKRKKRWSSHVVVDGKYIGLGVHYTEEEAYQAYLDALKKHGIINKYAAKNQEES